MCFDDINPRINSGLWKLASRLLILRRSVNSPQTLCQLFPGAVLAPPFRGEKWGQGSQKGASHQKKMVYHMYKYVVFDIKQHIITTF